MAKLSPDTERPELHAAAEPGGRAELDESRGSTGAWIPSMLCGLVLATSFAVASMSLWLVPPYLVLMTLLLVDYLPKSLVDKVLRRGRVIATNPGAETEPEVPAVESAAGPGTDFPPPEPESTGEPTEDEAEVAVPPPTRSKKKSRARSRKAKPIPSEPTPATWIQVAPGKFVRVEGPGSDAIPPPEVPLPADPVDVEPARDEDVREPVDDVLPPSEEPLRADLDDVEPDHDTDRADHEEGFREEAGIDAGVIEPSAEAVAAEVVPEPWSAPPVEASEEDSEAAIEEPEPAEAEENPPEAEIVADLPPPPIVAEAVREGGPERPFDAESHDQPVETDDEFDPRVPEASSADPSLGRDDSDDARGVIVVRNFAAGRWGFGRQRSFGRSDRRPRADARTRVYTRVVADSTDRAPRTRGIVGSRRRSLRAFPPRSPPRRGRSGRA